MKYIAYSEVFQYSMENIMKKLALYEEEVKKDPTKYPKQISPTYNTSGRKSFALLECDDEKQLLNLALFFFPELTIEFVAIFELTKVISEAQNMKK